MPITKRKCRVCGKEYEACRTTKRASGGFNWREVACSPECGEQYLRAVLEARGAVSGKMVVGNNLAVEKEEPANTGRKNKGKSGKRYERPAVVEEPVVTDDAVGSEAPAVSADTADDTVSDDADSEW